MASISVRIGRKALLAAALGALSIFALPQTARACFPHQCGNPLLHCVETDGNGHADPRSAYQLTIDRLGTEYSAWFTVQESRPRYLYEGSVRRSSRDNGNIDIYRGSDGQGSIDLRVEISGPADKIGDRYYYGADFGYESDEAGAFGFPMMCTYGYF